MVIAVRLRTADRVVFQPPGTTVDQVRASATMI
jgi:hypothetical protein